MSEWAMICTAHNLLKLERPGTEPRADAHAGKASHPNWAYRVTMFLQGRMHLASVSLRLFLKDLQDQGRMGLGSTRVPAYAFRLGGDFAFHPVASVPADRAQLANSKQVCRLST